jgi:hypothetical protein
MRLYPNTTVDSEFKTLRDAGYSGSLNDMQFSFLRSQGYINSLPDMMTSWLSFSPSILFSANEPGILLDPSDLTTLFQDTAGTTPVTTPGQSVARVNDKSGRGNHATQATSGSRPLYALLPANGVRNVATGSASIADTTYWPASRTENGITATKVASGFDTDGLPYADYRYQGTATNTFVSGVYTSGNGRNATVVGAQWTASAILRVVSGSLTGVSGLRVIAVEETAPSTFVANGNGNLVSGSSDEISTVTRTIATGNQISAGLTMTVTNGATIDVTFRVKGLQLELGSTRTAYQFNYSNTNIAQPPFAQVGALLFDGVDDFLQTPSVDFAGYEQLGSELVTNGTFTTDLTGWADAGGDGSAVASAGVMQITQGATAQEERRQNVTVQAGRFYKVSATLGGVSPFLFLGSIAGAADLGNISATGSIVVLATTNIISVRAIPQSALGSGSVATYDDISVREVLRPADKMTVFAGVRKLSDAAQGVLVELTSNASSTPNSFSLQAPGPATSYRIVSGGSLTAGAVYDATGLPAPRSSVLTGIANISGASASIRENGVQVAGGLANQGTGNYANALIYIGRRGGTLLPFNGYLYSLIVRGAATSTSLIAQTEAWVNQRTGAY